MTRPTTSDRAVRPTPDAPPLLIIAAGGTLPVHVAEAATAARRPVYIVGIAGEADAGIAAFPHVSLKWGQLGRLQRLAAEIGARDVVMVGTVTKRPDFRSLSVDPATLKLIPRILKSVVGGDDTVLGHVVRLFEEWGLRVVGPHEVATDLVAQPGPVAGPAPRPADLDDATVALEAAWAIGRLDAGQAAIAVDQRVVALEAAEGTDAIIRRVGELKASERFKWPGRRGVLAKCAKPTQDLRVDMPTIGPRTVKLVAEAGLAGIALEAGRVMIADRAATVAAAAELRTFIYAARLDRPDGAA
jgi:DUF1009 family protein